jgi:ATP-binding cassette, subfamily A (ABC1), member 3
VIAAGYSQEGFLALQNFISRAIIEQKLNKPLQNVTIQMQRFPHPEYIDDPLLVALQTFVSLIFMLSFVYTSISCVRMVTHEKENQLKVYAA